MDLFVSCWSLMRGERKAESRRTAWPESPGAGSRASASWPEVHLDGEMDFFSSLSREGKANRQKQMEVGARV